MKFRGVYDLSQAQDVLLNTRVKADGCFWPVGCEYRYYSTHFSSGTKENSCLVGFYRQDLAQSCSKPRIRERQVPEGSALCDEAGLISFCKILKK